MAIEPVRAGSFIPNKAGEPTALADNPKSGVEEAADKALKGASSKDDSTSKSGGPGGDAALDGQGGNAGGGQSGVDVKA